MVKDQLQAPAHDISFGNQTIENYFLEDKENFDPKSSVAQPKITQMHQIGLVKREKPLSDVTSLYVNNKAAERYAKSPIAEPMSEMRGQTGVKPLIPDFLADWKPRR
jgi:hypothetical protein